MTPEQQAAFTLAHDTYNAVAGLCGQPTIEDAQAAAVAAAVAPVQSSLDAANDANSQLMTTNSALAAKVQELSADIQAADAAIEKAKEDAAK